MSQSGALTQRTPFRQRNSICFRLSLTRSSWIGLTAPHGLLVNRLSHTFSSPRRPCARHEMGPANAVPLPSLKPFHLTASSPCGSRLTEVCLTQTLRRIPPNFGPMSLPQCDGSIRIASGMTRGLLSGVSQTRLHFHSPLPETLYAHIIHTNVQIRASCP